MDFRLDLAYPVLERTPGVLTALLDDLPAQWTTSSEGPQSWSAFDVVGHLVHGERTDWIPRARLILESGTARPFEPFDRFVQLEANRGRTIGELLAEFATLRAENVAVLRGWRLTDAHLALEGMHPELGRVTLGQHLATWVAHDQSHLAQIARTMARQLRDAVGPWRAYLRPLRE